MFITEIYSKFTEKPAGKIVKTVGDNGSDHVCRRPNDHINVGKRDQGNGAAHI
jgi:hypothetical protein